MVVGRLYTSYHHYSKKVSSRIEVYTSDFDELNGKPLKAVAEEVLAVVKYKPTPYSLFDHHGQLQTAGQYFLRNLSRLALHLVPFSNSFVFFERELVELSDGGVVAIDWAMLQGHSIDRSQNKPVIILHHGLVGDSQSEYIYHFIRKLIRNGYIVGVMIARGCGGLPLRTVFTFAGRKTGDVRAVVKRVRERYPKTKLFWMGYSLGAAATLQYLEDFHGQTDEEKSLLDAVMCVSPPWSFWAKKQSKFDVWSSLMVFPLKMYLLKHSHVLKNFPENRRTSLLRFFTIKDIFELNEECFHGFGGLTKEGNSFLVERAKRNGVLDQLIAEEEEISQSLDNESSKKMHHQLLQEHGTLQYHSVEEYYNDCSPVFRAHLISTPTLSISAKDDPICSHKDCPTRGKEIGPGLVVVKTAVGGHLAFPEGVLPLTSAWTDRVALEWFAKFL